MVEDGIFQVRAGILRVRVGTETFGFESGFFGPGCFCIQIGFEQIKTKEWALTITQAHSG
jgi:hypothetical protein